MRAQDNGHSNASQPQKPTIFCMVLHNFFDAAVLTTGEIVSVCGPAPQFESGRNLFQKFVVPFS